MTTTGIYPIPTGSKVNYQGHEWEVKAYWLGDPTRCLIGRYIEGERVPYMEEAQVADLEVVEICLESIKHPEGFFTPGQ